MNRRPSYLQAVAVTKTILSAAPAIGRLPRCKPDCRLSGQPSAASFAGICSAASGFVPKPCRPETR